MSDDKPIPPDERAAFVKRALPVIGFVIAVYLAGFFTGYLCCDAKYAVVPIGDVELYSGARYRVELVRVSP